MTTPPQSYMLNNTQNKHQTIHDSQLAGPSNTSPAHNSPPPVNNQLPTIFFKIKALRLHSPHLLHNHLSLPPLTKPTHLPTTTHKITFTTVPLTTKTTNNNQTYHHHLPTPQFPLRLPPLLKLTHLVPPHRKTLKQTQTNHHQLLQKIIKTNFPTINSLLSLFPKYPIWIPKHS